VTAYSPLTSVVTTRQQSVDAPVAKTPADGTNGTNGLNGAPGLPGTDGHDGATHTLNGHPVGEAAGAACPGEKATLVVQHVSGSTVRLRYGKSGSVQLALTCTNSGKAITGAKLEIATRVGTRPAIASDVMTDSQGHAVIQLAKGASRSLTVGYRMWADDVLARATATVKVRVVGRVSLKASRKMLRNGQAVTLRGKLAGGNVPRRGVTLTVQWKDGKRWRPFAQIKTNANGGFRYAYKFTRTNRKVSYRLRVQVSKGQVDYPFEATASKAVKVTVAP
jgi:hypothetical protein